MAKSNVATPTMSATKGENLFTEPGIESRAKNRISKGTNALDHEIPRLKILYNLDAGRGLIVLQRHLCAIVIAMASRTDRRGGGLLILEDI